MDSGEGPPSDDRPASTVDRISTGNEMESQSTDGKVGAEEADEGAGRGDSSEEEEEEDGDDDDAEETDGGGDDPAESQDIALRPTQQQPPPQPQPERSGILGMIKALLFRMFFIYMVSTLVQRGRQPVTDTKKEVSPVAVGNSSTVSNLFPKNMLMDMYIYISENTSMEDVSAGSLFWSKKGLRYGDWESCQNDDDSCKMHGTIEISEGVRDNGMLFMHVYFVKSDQLLNFTSAGSDNFVSGSQCLTRIYRELPAFQTQFSDVDNKSVTPSVHESVKLIPYWNPKMTFGLITDHSYWKLDSVPSPLDHYLKYVPDQPYYYPLVYFNSYWNLDRDYIPINSTTRTLQLSLTYLPLSLFRWNIYPVQSLSSLACSSFNKIRGSSNSQDFIKIAFLDNGLFLLIAVSIFPIVHIVLSFLAFRNEISFWSNHNSLEGLSVYCALSELATSLLALLYILSVETAFIFTLTAAVEVLIAIWKMTKVLDIQLTFQQRIFWIIPQMKVLERPTYISSQTKKYDRSAGVYMLYVLFPLLTIYIGHAAIVMEYKDWYTWTLAMLHGFLTSLGFIMMTPQIFINYKFKSTVHLPWRVLTYKAANTFLDSACAFVIQAPSYYRIGFFRHDQLYCIYLYQWWIYRQNNNSTNNNGEANSNSVLQETTS